MLAGRPRQPYDLEIVMPVRLCGQLTVEVLDFKNAELSTEGQLLIGYGVHEISIMATNSEYRVKLDISPPCSLPLI